MMVVVWNQRRVCSSCKRLSSVWEWFNVVVVSVVRTLGRWILEQVVMLGAI